MKTEQTINNSDILDGDKLYQQRARTTLPFLVRQAKAGQTIYYSDLADEIGIPNPRNLNVILGTIGNALIELGERTDIEMPIPQIQSLVINKKTNLPGEGIESFLGVDFSKLNTSQKQKITEKSLSEIFTYQYWDWVLEQFNLPPYFY